MEVIARDLDFPPGLTIPVCLAPDRLYNVEDTLAAVILEQQGEGEKIRFLRACSGSSDKEGNLGEAYCADEECGEVGDGVDEMTPKK